MGSDVSVGDLVDLAGETFARAEWVSLFLGVVGVYWLALGFGGCRIVVDRSAI